jgi:hypothetical protein
VPNSPRPIAAQAHTFIPVNGSVPLWAPVEDVAPLVDDVDVPVASVDGVWESDELLVPDEELLEPELDEVDEPLG